MYSSNEKTEGRRWYSLPYKPRVTETQAKFVKTILTNNCAMLAILTRIVSALIIKRKDGSSIYCKRAKGGSN